MQSSFFTADENARRQLRQLDAPLMVGDGAQLVDTDFVVSSRFVPTSVCAAIYLPSRRVAIRNCRLITEFATWDPAWAADSNLYNWVGLRIDGAQDLVIDGLHVEGFPQHGIQAYGLRTGRFLRVSGTRCLAGLAFSNPKGGSQNVMLDGFRAWDTWGPGPGLLAGIGGCPSKLRPGGWIGSGGLLAQVNDATLRNIDISGELDGGLKLTRSKRVCLIDAATNRLMIQGTEGQHANADGSTDGSEKITVRRVMVDKRRGYGDVSDKSNAVQVSFHVTGLDMQEFSLIAGGADGNGIQCWGNVQADFRAGVITGFNGLSGTAPAYALEYGDGSTINADFQTANWFHNQQRIVRAA